MNECDSSDQPVSIVVITVVVLFDVQVIGFILPKACLRSVVYATI